MLRLLFLPGLAVLIAGCAHGPTGPAPTPGADRYAQEHDSAPPDGDRPDVHAMEEPEPREEPLARYGNHSPYTVLGEAYEVLPEEKARNYSAEGIASWYGVKFHGYRTSSGEPFDMYQFTAAHRYLPLPAWVRVTNVENGESLVVRVNDRGPFHPDREIDLSWAAAERLGIAEQGTGRVRVEVIHPQTDQTPEDSVSIAEDPTLIPETGLHPGANDSAREPHFLQAGVFREQRSARALKQAMQSEFPWNTTLEATGEEDERMYRVRMGPFDTEEESEAARDQIVAAGHERPVPVPAE